MTVTIREAKRSDARMLALLSGELGYAVSEEEMSRRVDSVLSRRSDKIFVGETESVVGWIQVSLRQTIESGMFAEIVGLVVTESYRSAGIGKQLAAAAEVWAVRQGCGKIRVRTNSVREQARGFYSRIGYEPKKVQEVFDKSLSRDNKITV